MGADPDRAADRGDDQPEAGDGAPIGDAARGPAPAAAAFAAAGACACGVCRLGGWTGGRFSRRSAAERSRRTRARGVPCPSALPCPVPRSAPAVSAGADFGRIYGRYGGRFKGPLSRRRRGREIPEPRCISGTPGGGVDTSGSYFQPATICASCPAYRGFRWERLGIPMRKVALLAAIALSVAFANTSTSLAAKNAARLQCRSKIGNMFVSDLWNPYAVTSTTDAAPKAKEMAAKRRRARSNRLFGCGAHQPRAPACGVVRPKSASDACIRRRFRRLLAGTSASVAVARGCGAESTGNTKAWGFRESGFVPLARP